MTKTYFYNTFFGIDVDKKSYSFTIMNKDGFVKSKRIPANPEDFFNYMAKNYDISKVLCAYEAGPTGYHLYDYLTSKNCKCYVVSPASIPRPGNSKVKNNRIDSMTLAHYLKAGSLRSINIPTEDYRELRHLIRVREQCVIKRKTSFQRIKALLLFENLHNLIKEPSKGWSNKYINELRTLNCSFSVRTRLDMLLEDVDYAKKQVLKIIRILKEFIKEREELSNNIRYLQSLPGIGFIIAVSILGKTGDPKYIRNERELGSFMGLTPKEHSTGDKETRGPITRLGNKTLRSLLIEASWIAITKDKQLNQFFYRIFKKNHATIGAQKAIVAVARKMTQRIYRVLKDQREYILI